MQPLDVPEILIIVLFLGWVGLALHHYRWAKHKGHR
jgi:hypothetical protein